MNSPELEQPVSCQMQHAIIYQEPDSEPKYFDIETPLYLVEGKWQRWNHFVAFVDFWDKKAKRDADTLDVTLREDGSMEIT